MLRRWLVSTLARLPSQCAVCRSWQDQPLCESCIQRFAQPQPRCRTCAMPLAGGAAQCGSCLQHPPPLDTCLCAVDYVYPWTGCIAQFKYRQQPGWAGALADLLRHTPWVEPALERCAVVLPMPLSNARLRQRGFNQALELARRLAPHKTEAGLLLRIRDTAPQVALSAAERRRNVRGAFALEPLGADRIRGTDAVLVDDVMTSGASLFAAAEVLRAAGAARVSALVLARTPAPA
ncbi:ComF family protein [Pseudorhodoferax sp. Leaf274]|uniref:ComF family protein n=1 Tax=Pseudorhodoferax sp. Leaf274 TaxID=1736318 RepID=UPI000702E9D0|nr:ComF family protein [Pseudorhodoferax sp. Leaf274]KQP39721.1 phosphoribosyltransferase [Pseudorhodoferax sp. Leaf274]